MADTPKVLVEKRTAKSGREYYSSQYESSKTYDQKTIDQVRLRVRKGGKDKLQDYVKDKHEAEPDNPKYRSLNAFIVSVLQAETGIEDL